MEKEERFIYNPHLLNLLYQKVIYRNYLSRILSLFVYRRDGKEEEEEGEELSDIEREQLIRENLYDAQIVLDIYHLLERMKKEKIQFDIYHCNYEFCLFRMILLFLPQETELPQIFLERRNSFTNGLFLCEEKVQSLLEGSSISSVILHYIHKFYSSDLVNFQSTSLKRASLLFNIKKSAENRVLPSPALESSESRDYCVIYNVEVVMTMMYLFFMNEFIAILGDEKSFLSHSHYRRRFDDEEERRQSREKMEKRSRGIEEKILRLHRIYQSLDQYLDSQLSGPLLYSHPRDQPVEGEELLLSPYLRQTLQREREYTKMVNQRNLVNGNFFIKPKSIGHLRYLSLSQDKHLYQYVCRRFIFDNELLSSSSSSHQEKKCQTQPCQLCRYKRSIYSLKEFYETVEACHYTVVVERVEEENRRKIQWYLDGFLLDTIEAMDSVIYKNAWQTMKLFQSASSLNLFHIISVQEMLRYVREHYEREDGEGEYRVELILKQAKNTTKTAFRLEQWQIDLAIDQDIFELIYRAIGTQMHEIEKYERSILSVSRLVKEPGAMTTRTNSILSNIFLLYDSILLSTMRK